MQRLIGTDAQRLARALGTEFTLHPPHIAAAYQQTLDTAQNRSRRGSFSAPEVGAILMLASAEDTILTKLEWYAITPSDPEDPIAYRVCPPYSTAIAAAFAVEDRVMQLGCEAVYAYQLVQLVLGDSAWRFFARGADEDSIFRIVHASPEQRCRAALHAVLTHASVSNKRYNVPSFSQTRSPRRIHHMGSIPERESLTVEFKSDIKRLPDAALVATVVCLANTEGGVIYLGVEDDGRITGLHAEHQTVSGLSALIANRTSPPMSVRATTLIENGLLIARCLV